MEDNNFEIMEINSEIKVNETYKRRFPIGAELLPEKGAHFRVWAPLREKISVAILNENNNGNNLYELKKEGNGYFSGTIESAGEETLYKFKLDDDDFLYPDPVSRFQPEGPHGPSQIIDPFKYKWKTEEWKGCKLEGQIIYEMHIGTFTKEGTWEAAIKELPELARIGITSLEVMPVADFPGKFGWGYDGVNLFAPTRLYGSPDDFRKFIDEAHALGMSVLLDVVYNHFGPDGNYIAQFSKDYFTHDHITDWGDAINFYGDNSANVREFFRTNAGFWIEEYNLDGLRLDATQNIYDNSEINIMTEIAIAVKKRSRGKNAFIVAENESQEIKLVKPIREDGYGLGGLWNDDFHHSALVAATGMSEAYYTDYTGDPQELLSAVKYGYLFQGQYYEWQKKGRGTPTFGFNPEIFIHYLENHDQVANSGRGQRLHQLTSPGRYRALTALLLLTPQTPMLFQGEEFGSSKPFLFFADHNDELGKLVFKGRNEFLGQFKSLGTKEMQAELPDPGDYKNFEICKLDFSEREKNKQIYDLHIDLIKIRKKIKAFTNQKRGALDGAVLGPEAFVIRYFDEEEGDKLLMINLGRVIKRNSFSEPLLAAPENKKWNVIWYSENSKYGGTGIPVLDINEDWVIPAHTAVVLGY